MGAADGSGVGSGSGSGSIPAPRSRSRMTDLVARRHDGVVGEQREQRGVPGRGLREDHGDPVEALQRLGPHTLAELLGPPGSGPAPVAPAGRPPGTSPSRWVATSHAGPRSRPRARCARGSAGCPRCHVGERRPAHSVAGQGVAVIGAGWVEPTVPLLACTTATTTGPPPRTGDPPTLAQPRKAGVRVAQCFPASGPARADERGAINAEIRRAKAPVRRAGESPGS